MATISSPMGRNPRSGGAGQAASYKKGGTTKYQYKGTVTKGEATKSAAKSGTKSMVAAATKGISSGVSKMTPAQKSKAAQVAGNAAAKRVYNSSGADMNPGLFSIQERLKPYMNVSTTREEMNAAGKKASNQIMKMKKKGGSMKGKK